MAERMGTATSYVQCTMEVSTGCPQNCRRTDRGRWKRRSVLGGQVRWRGGAVAGGLSAKGCTDVGSSHYLRGRQECGKAGLFSTLNVRDDGGRV